MKSTPAGLLGILVFGAVYGGMLLGRFPRLRLDRTGIALLGAIALLAGGVVSQKDAVAAVDLPTMLLLFGLMVVSAQLRLGGFYAHVVKILSNLPVGPASLLGWVIAGAALLSAVFSNDIVCLAAAPVLVETATQRDLDPVPFLLGLACAANVGSAATLMGNPQNMLIGEMLAVSFAGYLLYAAVPTVLGLVITWAVIVLQSRGRWRSGARIAVASQPVARPPFNRWHAGKGLVVASVLLVVFLFDLWPRHLAALAAAGIVLSSRTFRSREMLGMVDWQLLVLFAGLFVVNYALKESGYPAACIAWVASRGVDLGSPAWLFAGTVVLSNAVSNVPAVMLLLPLAKHAASGPVLALASTLAGNLLVVGSIANIIVISAAERQGVFISWRRHARTGVPVTVLTLAVAALWLTLPYPWYGN